MVNYLDDGFSALADPTRRRVIEALLLGPQKASSLAELAGTSRASMSRHLRLLKSSGLVAVATSERDARERLYSLQADQFTAIQAWLDQVHAFWSEQLGSFVDHVEQLADDQLGEHR